MKISGKLKLIFLFRSLQQLRSSLSHLVSAEAQSTNINHSDTAIFSFENREQTLWRSVSWGLNSVNERADAYSYRMYCHSPKHQIPNGRGIHVFFFFF